MTKLQELLREARLVMTEREVSDMQYCGWGTRVESLITECRNRGYKESTIYGALRAVYYESAFERYKYLF
jgi:hypothetical protein